MGEGDLDVGLAQRFADLLVVRPADGQLFARIADVKAQLHVHARIGHLRDDDRGLRARENPVVALHDREEHLARFRRDFFVGDAELNVDPQRVLLRMIHDPVRDHLRVGQHHDLVAHGPDAGRPQRNLVHLPVLAVHHDVVAHPEGFVDEDGDARDEVLHRVTRGKTDGDTGDREPGHERRNVHAQLAEHHGPDEDESYDAVAPLEEALQSRLDARAAIEYLMERAIDDPIDDVKGQKRQERLHAVPQQQAG